MFASHCLLFVTPPLICLLLYLGPVALGITSWQVTSNCPAWECLISGSGCSRVWELSILTSLACAVPTMLVPAPQIRWWSGSNRAGLNIRSCDAPASRCSYNKGEVSSSLSKAVLTPLKLRTGEARQLGIARKLPGPGQVPKCAE